jgi:MFS family permease
MVSVIGQKLSDQPTTGRRTSHWLPAAIAVASVGWGANQFAPLLLLYRSQLGLSATELEAIFGVYAVGLVPGLLLGGPISDRHGRRRVLLAALIASLVASGLLAVGGLGWLYAGRLVAGVASGAAFSSGTAWIRELSANGPAETPHPGPRRATVAMTSGFAAGPMVAGGLAQWAAHPTVVPYLPHLVLAAVAVPLVALLPETATTTRDGSAAPRVRVSAPAHPRFRWVVAPLAPWVFGSASVALAYLPGLASGHSRGALGFAAVIATLTAVAGLAVQPLARAAEARGGRVPLGTALGLVVVGFLVSAVAAVLPHPALVVVAALLLGAGYGCAQVAGLAEVQRLAGPGELAGMTAFYQAISYLGFALPFLLATVQHRLPAGVPLLIIAALAAVTLVLTGRALTGQKPTGQKLTGRKVSP